MSDSDTATPTIEVNEHGASTGVTVEAPIVWLAVVSRFRPPCRTLMHVGGQTMAGGAMQRWPLRLASTRAT